MSEGNAVTALRHRLDVLLREHGEVKARVSEYQRRRWLSPGEELELRALQRLKLQKKDAIAAAERELTQLETQFRFE
jgi:hypothetical protein